MIELVKLISNLLISTSNEKQLQTFSNIKMKVKEKNVCLIYVVYN